MTWDGVESMHFAYWSSCVFTDSSTRAWIVTDFGCLGGALMIAMLSFSSSLTVLSHMLSYKFADSLFLRGQNTSCVFQQQEAGMTPEARRDRAAILRRDGGAPASGGVFAALRSLPALSHLLSLFFSYLPARGIPEVEAVGEDVFTD